MAAKINLPGDVYTCQQATDLARIQRATHVHKNKFGNLTFYRPSCLADAYRELGMKPTIGQWARMTFYHEGADQFTTASRWEHASSLPEGTEPIK
jgi:hypothetical protein